MEARWFKSGPHRGGLTGELPVVICLSFYKRDRAGGLQQSVAIEPSNPFKGCQLHRFLGLPRCATVSQLGKGVVLAVSFAAHRGRNARLGQSLAVADADVLRPPVRVVSQCPIALGQPGVQRLLQRVRLRKSARIELLTRQTAMRRANTSMTNATYSQPCQVEITAQVRDPELVRSIRPELPVDPVQRACRLEVTDGGSHHLAPNHAA